MTNGHFASYRKVWAANALFKAPDDAATNFQDKNKHPVLYCFGLLPQTAIPAQMEPENAGCAK